METKPYGKHQLYRGNYKMSKGGEIKIPEQSKWVVKKYSGNCSFAPIDESGLITLILEEEYPKRIIEDHGDWGEIAGGFWSVISFLTEDEAKSIAQQLIDAVTNTKRVEVQF